MKTIYLVRHCKAEGQDFAAALTPLGMEQAEKLTKCLLDRNVDTIISSPYVRAIGSIKPLAERLGLEIRQEKRLSERVLSSVDNPDWLTMLAHSFEDLDATYPGGESSREAMMRGVSVIKDVLSSDSQTTVLVTHGNLMTLLIKQFNPLFGFEQWKALTNPDIYQLSFAGEHPYKVERIWRR